MYWLLDEDKDREKVMKSQIMESGGLESKESIDGNV